MNILRVTFYFTLFVSLSSMSMIECSDLTGQEVVDFIKSEPNHEDLSRFYVDPPPPHIRRPLESNRKQLRQDSIALYDMYMEIAYPIRMTPVLLDGNTGYFVYDACPGYFHIESITEEGHVPGFGIYRFKENPNTTPEHRSKIEDDLLKQLREPVPEENIHLLLSEYQLALDSIPINWNTIRACLDISSSRFQLQRLPELIPLHKQVFDQARSYDETFDQFICYTINSSLHAIAMHHSEEALQIVDVALNPDYWEEPDEAVYKKLPIDCTYLSYSLRGKIINVALPVLTTDDVILEILRKWKEYYPLIPEDNMQIPDRIKRFNGFYNLRIDKLASGTWQSSYPKRDTINKNE